MISEVALYPKMARVLQVMRQDDFLQRLDEAYLLEDASAHDTDNFQTQQPSPETVATDGPGEVADVGVLRDILECLRKGDMEQAKRLQLQLDSSNPSVSTGTEVAITPLPAEVTKTPQPKQPKTDTLFMGRQPTKGREVTNVLYSYPRPTY